MLPHLQRLHHRLKPRGGRLVRVVRRAHLPLKPQRVQLRAPLLAPLRMSRTRGRLRGQQSAARPGEACSLRFEVELEVDILEIEDPSASSSARRSSRPVRIMHTHAYALSTDCRLTQRAVIAQGPELRVLPHAALPHAYGVMAVRPDVACSRNLKLNLTFEVQS
eukprot:TRINITY_DN13922_c0_g3_i2.p1 TRINITY_DN13922_c0_g3~~TRINITY_DN13922_c0_g3_i2.p1  ORF type:complete len:164 (+),score=7.83 TRINITY_DN13922_c0_g3_i2:1242-1733(+)